MAGNRYDRGWMAGRGYGREYGARRGPPGRGRYDAGMRGGYDRGWNEEMAYGREPGMMGGGPAKDKKFIQKLMRQLKDGATTLHIVDDKLGIAGYGLVARKNAGNTPYRFMPQLWGYGGGVFDEADPAPTYDEVRRRATQIAEVTRSRFMPPWKVSPGIGHFVGQRLQSRVPAVFGARELAGRDVHQRHAERDEPEGGEPQRKRRPGTGRGTRSQHQGAVMGPNVRAIVASMLRTCASRRRGG